jgi:hypothetical protein
LDGEIDEVGVHNHPVRWPEGSIVAEEQSRGDLRPAKHEPKQNNQPKRAQETYLNLSFELKQALTHSGRASPSPRPSSLGSARPACTYIKQKSRSSCTKKRTMEELMGKGEIIWRLTSVWSSC